MDKKIGILTGLTAVVLVLSVWIGFKNSSKLADHKDALQSEENRLANNQAEGKDLKAKIKATETEREELMAQSSDSKSKLEAVVAEIDELSSKVEEAEAALAEIEDKAVAASELKDQIDDSQDLLDQIDDSNKKIAQLKADIESEKASMEAAKEESDRAQAALASKKVIVDSWSTGKSAPSLSTSIRGVFSTWGFVTLSAGNAQGVVPGSILDVLRNGEVVAKLKVTTVEQNRSAADIIINDGQDTVALRSGDRVVAEQSAQ